MTVTGDTTERSAQRPTPEPSSGPGTTTQAMKDAVKRPTAFDRFADWVSEAMGRPMNIAFWFVLFTTSCFANVLGLNISSAFNSAVTVYVMIPLLLIPQMILSGLLFPFDKLNNLLSTKGKVPVVADLMVSRWAFEAMAVHQFLENEFEAPYNHYRKEEAIADFKSAYLADEVKRRNNFVLDNFENKNDSVKGLVVKELEVLHSIIIDEPFRQGLEKINIDKDLTPQKYSVAVGEQLDSFAEQYRNYYQAVYNKNVELIEKKMSFFEKKGYPVNEEKNLYFNESLSDLVKNVSVKNRWIEYHGQIIQQIDPIFQSPKPRNALDYRTHFFSPEKNFLGLRLSTFLFNIIVIWAMTGLFYLSLYFEWYKKLVDLFSKVNIPKRK